MGNCELRAELIRFCDSIRNYEHESGHSIYQDERESSEFVDVYLNSRPHPDKTAIRLLKDLVSLQNGAPLERDKEEYDKLMNEIYSFIDSGVEINTYTEDQVREAFKLGQQWVKDINDGNDPVSLNEWLSEQNSHSPTEPEFDTLQEGDWFEGSPDQYRKVLEFEGTLKEDAYDDFIEDCVNHGMVWQTEFGNGYIDNLTCYFKTQLTPEEFLRRAENTFKTK